MARRLMQLLLLVPLLLPLRGVRAAPSSQRCFLDDRAGGFDGAASAGALPALSPEARAEAAGGGPAPALRRRPGPVPLLVGKPCFPHGSHGRDEGAWPPQLLVGGLLQEPGPAGRPDGDGADIRVQHSFRFRDTATRVGYEGSEELTVRFGPRRAAKDEDALQC